jgi:hypothetical protein
MNRFTLMLAAVAVCGPFAADAAAKPSSMIYNDMATSTANSADISKQVADMNREVMALNNEVKSLEQQNDGAIYSSQLEGTIPTGG